MFEIISSLCKTIAVVCSGILIGFFLLYSFAFLKFYDKQNRIFPPMFENDKINEPFWYIEGEAGVKRNPIYTDDGIYLNDKGVALKRERYPDD